MSLAVIVMAKADTFRDANEREGHSKRPNNGFILLPEATITNSPEQVRFGQRES